MPAIEAFFYNRNMVIATKHAKEQVIAPLFEDRLQVRAFVAKNLDTDVLGTFSGETERVDDVLDTLRKKCRLAMDMHHCDLAVASEGSFGAHPGLPFASADDEWMMFIDTKHNLEIIGREICLQTNFNGAYIDDEAQLMTFANTALFPSHGLIVRNRKDSFSFIVKGITDQKMLIEAFSTCISTYGSVYLETDMRAVYNPSRMKVIGRVAENLVEKLLSPCPSCKMPGFSIAKYGDGLPCSQCGSATNSALYAKYMCQQCEFTQKVLFPHGKEMEDPMYCNMCNP
jgi:hypothetical protein